jgi:hypothetical protein
MIIYRLVTFKKKRKKKKRKVVAIVVDLSTGFMMLVIKTTWQLPLWHLEPSRGPCDAHKISGGYHQVGLCKNSRTRPAPSKLVFNFFFTGTG